MMNPNDEFLTVTELADYLRLKQGTVLGMVRRKEIPAYRIGKAYRFSSAEIEEWLSLNRADRKVEYLQLL